MQTHIVRLVLALFLATALIGCGAQSTKKQPSSQTTSSGSSSPSAKTPSPSSSSSSQSSSPATSPSAGGGPSSSSPAAGTVGRSGPPSGQQRSGTGSKSKTTATNTQPDGRAQEPGSAEAENAPYASSEQSAEQKNAPTADTSERPSSEIDLSETSNDASSASSDQARESQPTNSGPAQSAQERLEQLETAFEGSISNYDGIILREREYIANRNNARGSEEDLEEEVNGPLFDEIGSTEPDGSKENGPGPAYESSTNSDSGNLPPGAGKGGGGVGSRTAGAVPPEDIPSGNDDDVVARQIREAALNETDPELREKLWEEYRRYKNQQ